MKKPVLSRIRLIRAAGAVGVAGALAATAAMAGETFAPIPPPRPGLVESPKGDGRQLTPLRRTTHEERLYAALRAAERRRARQAGAPAQPPSGTTR